MYLKRMNDHTVRLLTHGLEPLCAMSWFHGGRNRNDRLRSAWDIVLRNHGSNELGGLGPDSHTWTWKMTSDMLRRLLRWLWKMYE